MLYEVITSYAETLAMASGNGLTGKAKVLIDKALKLDPQHAHTLFLAGAAAMEAGDRKNGIVITSYSIHYTKLYDSRYRYRDRCSAKGRRRVAA